VRRSRDEYLGGRNCYLLKKHCRRSRECGHFLTRRVCRSGTWVPSTLGRLPYWRATSRRWSSSLLFTCSSSCLISRASILCSCGANLAESQTVKLSKTKPWLSTKFRTPKSELPIAHFTLQVKARFNSLLTGRVSIARNRFFSKDWLMPPAARR